MFIFLSSVILGRRRASQNQSHFAPFLLFILDHLSFFLPGYFVQENKHVEHIFDMICLGQNRAFFCIEKLGFSGYLVYLQMLPFCILQRVSKHCVAMLLLLNLH